VHGPVDLRPLRRDRRADYGHGIRQYGCLGDLVSRFATRGTAKGLDTTYVDAIVPPLFTMP